MRKFVFDCLSDNTGAWCGARVGIMAAFVFLDYKFLGGQCTVGEFVAGVALLAAAYAGKDYVERK